MDKIKEKLKVNKTFDALLLLFFFSLPFERIPTFDIAGFTLKISYILGLAILFYALVYLRSFFNKSKFKTSDIILWSFWLLGIISVLFAQDRKRAIITILMWAFVFLIYLVLKNKLSKEIILKIEQILIIVSVIIAIFGLYQFIADSLGVSRNFTFLRERYTRGVLGFPRVQSVALEPLYFANFLLVPIFLLVKNYFLDKRIFSKNFWFLSLILTSFILTVSRGAYLALLIGLILFFIYCLLYFKEKISRFYGIVISGIFAMALSSIFIFGLNGLSSLNNFGDHVAIQDQTNTVSVEGRAQGYKIAIEKFQTHPTFGVGVGNSGLLSAPINDRGEVFNYASLNNIYLEILAETGAAGFIFFICFLAAFAYEIYSLVKKSSVNQKFEIAAISCGIVAIFIQYNFFSTLYIIYIWAFMSLLYAKARD